MYPDNRNPYPLNQNQNPQYGNPYPLNQNQNPQYGNPYPPNQNQNPQYGNPYPPNYNQRPADNRKEEPGKGFAVASMVLGLISLVLFCNCFWNYTSGETKTEPWNGSCRYCNSCSWYTCICNVLAFDYSCSRQNQWAG